MAYKKILNIIASANPAGGGTITWVRDSTEELVRQGHSVDLLTFDPPDSPWVNTFPGTLHAVGSRPDLYSYSPAAIGWLTSRGAAYDHVIVHGVWQYQTLATWIAMRRLRKPYFVYTHGMLDPWFNLAMPRKRLKKNIYWSLIEYKVLRDAAAVIFTGDEERDLARTAFHPSVYREAVASLGISVSPNDKPGLRDAFFNRYPDLRGKRLLLFAGRLHPKKGCDLLIQAYANASKTDDNLHLVMAGPDHDGYMGLLSRQAEQLGVQDKITWTGMLQDDEKWGAYHAADLFVLASHQENFGLAVAEALARGIPVLISNKVNIWREIEADGAGIVINDTAESVTDGLSRWLAMSGADRQAMGTRSRRCYATRYEITTAVNALLNVLDQYSSQQF